MIILFFTGIRTVLGTEVSVTHKYIGETGINQNHPVKSGKYGPPTQMQCCLWAKMRWKWKCCLGLLEMLLKRECGYRLKVNEWRKIPCENESHVSRRDHIIFRQRGLQSKESYQDKGHDIMMKGINSLVRLKHPPWYIFLKSEYLTDGTARRNRWIH